MGNYTKTGPFNSGAAPGIDSGFLNAVETCIFNGGMIYLITPAQLLNSVAFTSGQVQTFTAWGTGGIPASGPTAILIGANTTSASTGQSAAFYPNGGTSGNYFSAGNVQVANGFANVFGIVPLDGTGKFNVKSVNAAGTITVWCFGYVQ